MILRNARCNNKVYSKRCVYCFIVILYKHNIFMIFMKCQFFVIFLMLPVFPTGCPFSARFAHFELFSQLCIESACSLNLIRKLPIVWPIHLWKLPGTLFDEFPPSLTYFDYFGLPFLRVARFVFRLL